MGHPDGAHTHHGSGSGGIGVLAVVAVIAAVALAVPVLTIVAHVLELLAVVVLAIVVLALAGGAALMVYRLRQGRRSTPLLVRQVPPVTRRAAQAVQEPRRAIGAPSEVHLHFHGVDAEDVAAILAKQNRPPSPRG